MKESSRARILVPAAKRQKLEKKKRLGVQMGTGPLPVVVGCTPSSHQMVGTSSSSGMHLHHRLCCSYSSK
ncbi:hypothetical protein OPV22_011480 [Ensete ventricosum]|uniref:Uncharacterized protein n=1 Tax=Ensete ventricosum TaxID=4639 RepID=A0AAV8RKM3_ENSVE|nr:hypothetical protein OPV22_011480 [Ensete ventricosum]